MSPHSPSKTAFGRASTFLSHQQITEMHTFGDSMTNHASFALIRGPQPREVEYRP
jgi:hypothetical protein